MNAREAINKAVNDALQWRDKTYATAVIEALHAAGFTIMSKEDVERIERAILDDREGKVSAATVLHMIKDAMQR